jgi:hypothetical protein
LVNGVEKARASTGGVSNCAFAFGQQISAHRPLAQVLLQLGHGWVVLGPEGMNGRWCLAHDLRERPVRTSPAERASGHAKIHFAPKATEVLRCRELTRCVSDSERRYGLRRAAQTTHFSNRRVEYFRYAPTL